MARGDDMTTEPSLLAQTTLTGGSTEDTVYTAPAATTVVLTYISVTNTGSSDGTVTIKVGDAGSEKVWRYNMSVAAGGTVEFTGTMTLEESDVLKMAADVTTIDVLVVGLEKT